MVTADLLARARAGDGEAFRELAHSFLAKECAPNEDRWCEQQHVDREVWLKAGELGLLCPSIPTE